MNAFKLITASLLFCLGVMSFSTAVVAKEDVVEAAKAIMVKGEAYSQSFSGEKRELSRRSPIYVGDTIVTGEDSILQIRFSDRALMTLRENTIFYIEEYVPSDSEKGGKALMQLLSGGLRTMTGAIGKKSGEEYSVKTNAASIGIRGTFYDAVILENDSLAMATWEGEVVVTNAAGSLAIGPDQTHRYATIMPNQPPKGQLKPPKEISVPDQYKKKDSDKKQENKGKAEKNQTNETEESEDSEENSEEESDGSETQDEDSEDTGGDDTDEGESEGESADEAQSDEGEEQGNEDSEADQQEQGADGEADQEQSSENETEQTQSADAEDVSGESSTEGNNAKSTDEGGSSGQTSSTTTAGNGAASAGESENQNTAQSAGSQTSSVNTTSRPRPRPNATQLPQPSGTLGGALSGGSVATQGGTQQLTLDADALSVDSLGNLGGSLAVVEPIETFADLNNNINPIELSQELLNTEAITNNLAETTLTDELEEAQVFGDPRLTLQERGQIGSTARLGLVTELKTETDQATTLSSSHALALTNANNEPIFVAKANSGSDQLIDPNVTQTARYDIYRRENAVNEFIDSDVGGLGKVGWGIWDGTTASGGIYQNSLTNTVNPAQRAIRMLWVNAEPELQTPLTGVMSFSADSLRTPELTPFLAESTLGSVSSVQALFNINFDNATMGNGSNLNISFDDSRIDAYWRVILEGQLINYDKGQFSLELNDSVSSEAFMGPNQLCTDCIKGDINGIILQGAESAVSTFDLQAQNPDTNAIEHTSGAVLLRK